MRIKVILKNRYAEFKRPYPDELKDQFGYLSPGAFFSPLYKKKLWNGIISFLKYDRVPSGLFLALKDKIEAEWDVKFKIYDERKYPRFFEHRDESDRRYQNKCIRRMRDCSNTGGTVLCATGCIIGDTLIDTPRDLKQYPYGIPIRSLVGSKPWVYGWNSRKQRIDLAQALTVVKTGVKVPVWKVTFKQIRRHNRFGESKYHPPNFIIATHEHPFLLRLRKNIGKKYDHRNGFNFAEDKWITLDRLKVGDRVMPFIRNMAEDPDYIKVNLNNGKSEIESRFILSKIKGKHTTYFHAHHRDNNTWNNSVANLKWKTKYKHISNHSSKRNKNKLSGWQVTGIHPRGMKNKPQTEHQKLCASLTKNILNNLYHKEGLSIQDIANKYNTTAWFIKRRLYFHNINIENNHIVEKIEFYGYKNVYNMQVPKLHSFVANGVVTHNTGKTYIAGKYFAELDGNGVFIVDELGLLKQAQEELARVMDEPVGYIGNMKFRPKRITVATVQTMQRHRLDPKFAPWHKSLDAVIIDELHEMLGKRNHTIVSNIKPKACIGLTATLRLDKKPIRMKAMALTGPVIYEFPLSEGVDKKYLTPGVVISVEVEKPGHKHLEFWNDYDKVIAKSGKFNKIIEKIIKAGIKHDKYILQLLKRPKHVRTISKRLKLVPHAVAYGAIRVRDRIAAKQQFENKFIKLLIANQVFKKGTNIKRVDMIIDAANMPSSDDAKQKYGRGVRLCSNKYGLIYIDIGFRNKDGVTKKSYSYNRFAKATRIRRRALAQLGVPVYTIKWNGSGTEVVKYALRKLEKELKRRNKTS